MSNDNKARQHFTYDDELNLADEVTSTGAVAHGQVDGGNGTVNVGTALFRGSLILDVDAIAIDGGDEGYYFELMGIEPGGDEYTLASLDLGDADALLGSGDVDRNGVGRYVVPVTNYAGPDPASGDGVICDQLYVKLAVVGSTVSVTWKAWLAQDPH